MSNGIWATWYDLPDGDQPAYFDWLHHYHLPRLQRRVGFAWAAHYRISGGDKNMDKIHDHLARADDAVATGSQYLVLVGATSPHVFFKPRIDQWQQDLSGNDADMLALRIGSRSCFFAEEASVTGPEYGTAVDGGCSAPAIQMGSFQTKTLEDELDLAAWYAQYRLPAMARMPGCVGTRKLVSVAGWAKHSILYEFTSLKARLDSFQNHESQALDDKVWTNKIINYTVHAPGSPSIGERIWPAVDVGWENINENGDT